MDCVCVWLDGGIAVNEHARGEGGGGRVIFAHPDFVVTSSRVPYLHRIVVKLLHIIWGSCQLYAYSRYNGFSNSKNASSKSILCLTIFSIAVSVVVLD